MKVTAYFFLILFGSSTAWAFQNAPAPIPSSTPDPQEATRRIRQYERDSQRFETLRDGGKAISNERKRSITRNEIEPLYRTATRKELATVSPNPNDFDRYRDLLKKSGTGLTRLMNDAGCDGGTNVVVVTDECLKYSMPGGGTSYSFRTDGYRIRRLADLTFSEGLLGGKGVLNHSILVSLGNIELENVTLNTSGMKYLISFVPETDFEKARKVDLDLITGITSDGFLYRRSVSAVEGVTFALRSIAYKGKFYRAVDGFAYNELDFDKRQDIIVVFRIVRKDPDGSVTILWRVLDRNDSPTVRQTKKDNEQILRENKFTAIWSFFGKR